MEKSVENIERSTPSPKRLRFSSSSESPNNGSAVISFDLGVLDCPICYEPFTIPVFQCESGHTTCNSCCLNLENKCPSCNSAIGAIRCRAIEQVLESLKVSCQNNKYGCTESFYYIQKAMHDKICTYGPFSCPISGCSSRGSSKQLYDHCREKHADSVKQFSFNDTFGISFETDVEYMVLHEEKEGVVFVLSNRSVDTGKVIAVSAFGHGEPKFQYHLNTNRCGFKFQSLAKMIQNVNDSSPLCGFFLDEAYFHYGKWFILEICIKKYGLY